MKRTGTFFKRWKLFSRCFAALALAVAGILLFFLYRMFSEEETGLPAQRSGVEHLTWVFDPEDDGSLQGISGESLIWLSKGTFRAMDIATREKTELGTIEWNYASGKDAWCGGKQYFLEWEDESILWEIDPAERRVETVATIDGFVDFYWGAGEHVMWLQEEETADTIVRLNPQTRERKTVLQTEEGVRFEAAAADGASLYVLYRSFGNGVSGYRLREYALEDFRLLRDLSLDVDKKYFRQPVSTIKVAGSFAFLTNQAGESLICRLQDEKAEEFLPVLQGRTLAFGAETEATPRKVFYTRWSRECAVLDIQTGEVLPLTLDLKKGHLIQGIQAGDGKLVVRTVPQDAVGSSPGTLYLYDYAQIVAAAG